jgi:hypothetical protein
LIGKLVRHDDRILLPRAHVDLTDGHSSLFQVQAQVLVDRITPAEVRLEVGCYLTGLDFAAPSDARPFTIAQ